MTSKHNILKNIFKISFGKEKKLDPDWHKKISDKKEIKFKTLIRCHMKCSPPPRGASAPTNV
jgi:hypothetical protein